MGWIQLISYKELGKNEPTTIIDAPPQLIDSGSPFFSSGPLPSMLDAPCMITDERSKKGGIDWAMKP